MHNRGKKSTLEGWGVDGDKEVEMVTTNPLKKFVYKREKSDGGKPVR
jgi:hypothetical protein